MLALLASRRDCLDLKQALGHDEVHGTRIDEMPTEPRYDFAERLDERSYRDGAYGGRYGREWSVIQCETELTVRTREERGKCCVCLGGNNSDMVVAW